MIRIPPDYYAAFLDLTERECLVVGTGPVADEKNAALEAAGAKVTIVGSEEFTPADLEGKWLVVSATEIPEIDKVVADEAARRKIFLNVPDVPDLCSFILPAVVRRDPLAIAISTGGASPALAVKIKNEIAATYGDAHARFAILLRELRPWAKANLTGYSARKMFFDEIVEGPPDPIALIEQGREAELIAHIEDLKTRAIA